MIFACIDNNKNNLLADIQRYFLEKFVAKCVSNIGIFLDLRISTGINYIYIVRNLRL